MSPAGIGGKHRAAEMFAPFGPPAGRWEASRMRRGAGVGVFLLAIATAGALAHVAVRLKSLEVAYDLGRERRIATEMEEQRRRLQIEIGMLKDPGRVISIARDRLDMGPPAPEAIWRIGSGDHAGSDGGAATVGAGVGRGAPAPAMARPGPAARKAKAKDKAGTANGTKTAPAAETGIEAATAGRTATASGAGSKAATTAHPETGTEEGAR